MAQVYVTPQYIALRADPVYRAYRLLQVGFVIVPFMLGLDTFFGMLTDWSLYIASAVVSFFSSSPDTIAQGVGVLCIIAALATIIRPKIGGIMLAAVFGLMMVNLFLLGNYDVAVLVAWLVIGSLALVYLGKSFDLGLN